MSDADIRAWAEANGRAVGARGGISKALRDDYETAQLEAALSDGPSDADFGDVAEPGPPPADVTERKPRTIPAPRTRRGARDWLGRPRKAKPKGKARPRVPVDDLIAGVWRAAAGFARPLPATSRLLKMQAPVAGAVLEDAVKGTFVDTVLQPVARAGQTGEAFAVLVLPPVLVAAIELDPGRMPFLLPPLRELMLRWAHVAGPKMAAALAREREFEEQFGEDVDGLLAMLFEGMDAAAEEAAVRDAQETVGASA
jgi:hypothetical protein